VHQIPNPVDNNSNATTTSPRNSAILDQVIQFLVEKDISDASDLNRPGSPQYQAALWIAGINETNIYSLKLNTYNFIFRYVMAVNYYALDGGGGGDRKWLYPLNRLGPDNDVCFWKGAIPVEEFGFQTAGVICVNDEGDPNKLRLCT
jgi:hypothetical protein